MSTKSVNNLISNWNYRNNNKLSQLGISPIPLDINLEEYQQLRKEKIAIIKEKFYNYRPKKEKKFSKFLKEHTDRNRHQIMSGQNDPIPPYSKEDLTNGELIDILHYKMSLLKPSRLLYDEYIKKNPEMSKWICVVDNTHLYTSDTYEGIIEHRVIGKPWFNKEYISPIEDRKTEPEQQIIGPILTDEQNSLCWELEKFNINPLELSKGRIDEAHSKILPILEDFYHYHLYKELGKEYPMLDIVTNQFKDWEFELSFTKKKCDDK